MKNIIPLLASVFIASVLFLIRCGGISPSDPTGFGVWSGDCRTIAVAVNREDYDNRPLMNHATNERCALYLCDSTGKVIRVLFESRTVDGNPTRIDSLEFNEEEDNIIVYSVLYGTGKVKKEKITISTGIIEEVATIETIDWGITHTLISAPCDSRCIKWNYETKWITIGADACR